VPVQRCDNRANLFRSATGRFIGWKRIQSYGGPAVRARDKIGSMPKDLGDLLRLTIERELPHLLAVTNDEASRNDGRAGSWTRKQELGHLIDSATNNHVRFVLATVDGEFRGLGYAQEKWVDAHGYNEMEWRALVDFWYSYNALIAHLVERIPEEHMRNRCVIGWGVQTLRFVIEDYVVHMQHHLDHVLAREKITPYPPVSTPAAST